MRAHAHTCARRGNTLTSAISAGGRKDGNAILQARAPRAARRVEPPPGASPCGSGARNASAACSSSAAIGSRMSPRMPCTNTSRGVGRGIGRGARRSAARHDAQCCNCASKCPYSKLHTTNSRTKLSHAVARICRVPVGSRPPAPPAPRALPWASVGNSGDFCFLPFGCVAAPVSEVKFRTTPYPRTCAPLCPRRGPTRRGKPSDPHNDAQDAWTVPRRRRRRLGERARRHAGTHLARAFRCRSRARLRAAALGAAPRRAQGLSAMLKTREAWARRARAKRARRARARDRAHQPPGGFACAVRTRFHAGGRARERRSPEHLAT